MVYNLTTFGKSPDTRGVLRQSPVAPFTNMLKLDIHGKPQRSNPDEYDKQPVSIYNKHHQAWTMCISRDTLWHSRLELFGEERLCAQSVVFYVVHFDLTVSTTEPIAG